MWLGEQVAAVVVYMSVAAALLSALLIRESDVGLPYLQAGVPFTILFLGSGVYVLSTQGVDGLILSYAQAVFIGGVFAALNRFLSGAKV